MERRGLSRVWVGRFSEYLPPKGSGNRSFAAADHVAI